MRNKVFQYRNCVKFYDYEENSFIIDTSKNALYNLGTSSALISANIDGEKNLGEIIKIIKKNYDVSTRESVSVVVDFIGRMKRKNLIEEVPTN